MPDASSAPFRPSATTLTVLTGCAVAAGATAVLPVQARPMAVEFCTVFLGALGAGFFLVRGAAGGPTRWFHLLMGIALGLRSLVMMLGMLAYIGLPLLSLPPTTSLGVALAGHALQGAALLTWPGQEEARGLRWREALDALLFTLATFLVFWLLGLGELLAKTQLPVGQKLVNVLYFTNYTLLMGLTLYRGLNAVQRFRSSLGWMLLAFLVAALGNLAWVTLTLRETYFRGHPMDSLILLLGAFYLLAALAEPPPAQPLPPRPRSWGGMLVPYIPFMIALPLAVAPLFRAGNSNDPVVVSLGLFLIFILLLRQGAALWDATAVSRNLDREVRARTRALEESQATLLRVQRMNIMATLGAGLAHDLKNLMGIAQISGEMLADQLAGAPEEAKDTLASLRRAQAQASDMLMRLMAFGREKGEDPVVFDLRGRVAEMGRILDRLAAPRLTVQLDLGEAPLLVELDPTGVEQILVNLVVNARDAMPGGGQVRVRTRAEGGAWAVLEVEDSGSGIAPEDLARVFEPFYSTKPSGRGTGLGLASVRAIAEECGGTAGATSQAGKGSVFSVRFPRR